MSEQLGQVPPIVSWVVTGVCNMRCLHCYPESGPDSQGPELTREEQLDAVEKFARAGVTGVFLSGGESLLVPHLFDLIEKINAHGMTTWICTNGTRVNRETADRIADAGVHGVSVSIDSADKSTHDAFRVSPGALSRAIRAIHLLRARGVTVDVDYTATKANYRDAGRVATLAGELGARSLFFKRFRPVGRGAANAQDLALTLEQYRSTAYELLDAAQRSGIDIKTEDPALMTFWRQSGAVGQDSSSLYASVGCFAGVVWTGVLSNGEVTPCPLLPVSIGNIAKSELTDLVEGSELMKAMADRDQRGGACGTCEERWRCGGCRAHAYAETGDCLAADPYCSYLEDDS